MTQPTPESQPEQAVIQPVTPEPPEQPVSEPVVQAVQLSPEATNLHNYLKMIDPNQEGVGLDKVRPIYPKVGWNVILGHCAELESAKMLTKRFVPGPSGRGGYDLYRWQ